MERIRGLEEYVKNKEYREALRLPKEKTENYELQSTVQEEQVKVRSLN